MRTKFHPIGSSDLRRGEKKIVIRISNIDDLKKCFANKSLEKYYPTNLMSWPRMYLHLGRIIKIFSWRRNELICSSQALIKECFEFLRKRMSYMSEFSFLVWFNNGVIRCCMYAISWCTISHNISSFLYFFC